MPASATDSFRIPFWAWAALPATLAVWLRFRGIGGPEAFVDEAGNILAALDPRVRVVVDPLGQGRPWLAGLYWPAGLFPGHILAAARMMTAGAGLATVAALGWMLHRLAGRKTALCGMWVWTVMPFAVFHERLALQDPFVTALLAWVMALGVQGNLASNSRTNWPWFVAAGVLFGAALLLKVSAVLSLPWLGLFYLLLRVSARQQVWDFRLALVGLGVLLPGLTLGSDLWRVGGNFSRYGVLTSLSEAGYAASTLARLRMWIDWYAGYGGWPLLLLIGVAVFLAFRGRSRLALGCGIGWLLSLVVAAAVYNRIYARYALPDHLPLVLFFSLSLGAALERAGWTRRVVMALLSLALARWVFVSWQIGTDPVHAAVPADEIAQYFTGKWSGRGLNEVRRYLAGYADRHDVRCLVLTHKYMRPGCYGLMLTELGDPRIGVVPFTVYEPEELAASLPGLRHATAGRRAAFFLLYEGILYPPFPWLDQAGSPARRVLEVPRGEGGNFALYQFEP